MNKDKRILGAALAVVTGASVVMPLTTQVVEAKAPNTVKDIEGRLNSLISSVKKNYLSLKNIDKWQKDIKVIKDLVNKMPKGSIKDKFLQRISKVESVLIAGGNISKLEDSMKKNANIIKNVKGWEAHVESIKKDLAKVDHKEFHSQYEAILKRVATANTAIKGIKDTYQAKVGEIQSTYNKAMELSKTQKDRALAMLKFCIEEANKLNSHPLKDELIAKINKAIEEINKIPSVDPFIKDDKGNVTVKDEIASVDITPQSLGTDKVNKLVLPYGTSARISGVNVETVVIKSKALNGPADQKPGGLYVTAANVTTIISSASSNIVVGDKTRVETAVLIEGGNLMIMKGGGIFNLEMLKGTNLSLDGFVGNLVSSIKSAEKVVVKQGPTAMILKAIYANGYDSIEGVTNKVAGTKVVLPQGQYKQFTVATTTTSAEGASFHVKPVAGFNVTEVKINGVTLQKDPQRGSYKMPALVEGQTQYTIEVIVTPTTAARTASISYTEYKTASNASVDTVKVKALESKKETGETIAITL
ncbi:MAG: hypothetical protein RR840_02185 [Clostridium sp.]